MSQRRRCDCGQLLTESDENKCPACKNRAREIATQAAMGFLGVVGSVIAVVLNKGRKG